MYNAKGADMHLHEATDPKDISDKQFLSSAKTAAGDVVSFVARSTQVQWIIS